jgi:hypothetical protein
VASTDYWVEISRQGMRLGAGFLLTRHHVLTAFHCLRSIDSDDSQFELSFATGEVAPGRLCEHSPGADLALIDIIKPRESALILPNADRAGQGDMWSAPYRPSTGDPYLSGNVLNGAMTYRCEAGHEIEALQLGCSQRLGDYSGYSGGPVERNVTGQDPAVLGVLLEQYPDRQAAERASDVLFAATIAEALRRFDCLGVPHLMKVLSADNGAPEKRFPARTSHQPDETRSAEAPRRPPRLGSSPSLESRIAAASAVLNALHDWGNSGVLDPMYVSELKLRVARRVVEGNWSDDA